MTGAAAGPTSRHVTVDGARIHYVEHGEGPPVLFIHGNPTSSYLWRNITPPLANTHRTIAIDLLGFGRSEHPPGCRYDFDDHAAVIEGFIEALGLGDGLSLVLHDWGGILGMHYAVRHRRRLARVALLSTFVAPVSFPASGLLMRAPRLPGVGSLLVQRMNLFLPLALRAGVVRWSKLTPEVRAAYRRPFPDAASRYPIRRWTEQLPARPADRVSRVLDMIGEVLPAFDVPVLILRGRFDPILSMARARTLARMLPDARLEVVPRAGHFMQEDQPERVAASLRAFLTEGQAGSTA